MARLTLTGQEILVVDQDDRVLRGLDRLFRESGLIVTGVTDVSRARDQLANKFFPVAIIDLDTPTANAGLELVAFAKERAPLTELVVMAGQRSFEAAASALRAGAADVVPKTQDAVDYLRDRVAAMCREINAKVSRDRLLGQVADLHEEFLTGMMDLSRRAVDMEDRLLSRDGGEGSSTYVGMTHVNLLLVDDDASLATALQRALSEERGWRIDVVSSGGEALDATTRRTPQIVVVKETLPDLPSSMVMKSIKSSVPDVVALMFSPPTRERVGEVKMVDASRLITLIPSFTDPAQMVASLEEVRDGIREKAKERRYLKVFRRDHMEFLKRYNRLREDLLAATTKKSGG